MVIDLDQAAVELCQTFFQVLVVGVEEEVELRKVHDHLEQEVSAEYHIYHPWGDAEVVAAVDYHEIDNRGPTVNH